VLDWTAHVAGLVRSHDPNHLITAGWLQDSLATEPFVDFLSFHHWTNASDLEGRLTDLKRRSSKPILLQEVGLPGEGDATEREQARQLALMLEVVEENAIAGWMVWTAFDFVPPPGQALNHQHRFGLWRSDLSPKPALAVLPLPTPDP
jgi:endo-1,4-beta-mannosidase